jgi:hypothetical protein
MSEIETRSRKSSSKYLETIFPWRSTMYVPGRGMPYWVVLGFTVSFRIPKARIILDSGSDSSGKVILRRSAKFFRIATES